MLEEQLALRRGQPLAPEEKAAQQAAQERRFALEPIGARVKVLSTRPSEKTDKFGGSSSSVLAEVIGVGIIEPASVLEKMPFSRTLLGRHAACGVPEGSGISTQSPRHVLRRIWQLHDTVSGQCARSLTEV